MDTARSLGVAVTTAQAQAPPQAASASGRARKFFSTRFTSTRPRPIGFPLLVRFSRASYVEMIEGATFGIIAADRPPSFAPAAGIVVAASQGLRSDGRPHQTDPARSVSRVC